MRRRLDAPQTQPDAHQHKRQQPSVQVAVALHEVAHQVVRVGDEPVRRAEAVGVRLGELRHLGREGHGVEQVGIDRPQVGPHRRGLRCAERQHRYRQHGQQQQGQQQRAPLFQVITEVRERQEHRGRGHDHLAVGVRVEGGRAEQDGDEEIARRTRAIQHIEQQKARVERGHHHRLETGAGVQEPGRRHGHQQRARPPVARLEDQLQHQRHGDRSQQAHHHRRRPGDKNALAEHRHRDGVHVHRQQRCPPVARRLEVDRQEVVRGVFQSPVEQILRVDCMCRLVGKEVDRELVDGRQPGIGINEHTQGKQNPAEARNGHCRSPRRIGLRRRRRDHAGRGDRERLDWASRLGSRLFPFAPGHCDGRHGHSLGRERLAALWRDCDVYRRTIGQRQRLGRPQHPLNIDGVGFQPRPPAADIADDERQETDQG